MEKDKLLDFLKQGKWKNLKKSDWAVIGLAGILLLVIAMPLETKENEQSSGKNQRTSDSMETGETGNTKQMAAEEDVEDAYVNQLEERLEAVLGQMDGVGAVKVMITVSDSGEAVIEKDRVSESTITSEIDSTGGNRSVSEISGEEATVYVETGEETYPYIQKEKVPTVEGVVVVAEGGDNSRVIANISESVKALLPVEVHRIKVVKMCSKEE